MEMLVQTIVSGLATGSLYALAALGIVLIFNTTGILNFAQGEIGMFSTFIAFTALSAFGFTFLQAVLVGVLFAALLGMAVERLLIRPIRNAPHLSQIMVTLGLFMILNGVAGLIWGYDARVFPAVWQGSVFQFAGIVLDRQSALIFLVAAVIALALFSIFRFSMLGIAMRAAAQDMVATRLMGVKINRVFSAGWVISAILAAVAGMLIAPQTFLDPNMMLEVLLKAFVASVIGGFTSMPGAILGGLLLGTSENLIAAYVSTDLKTAFSFGLIVLMLMIRPYGLLGRSEGKRV
jgi:branched-chain amino acid transport system permease protein